MSSALFLKGYDLSDEGPGRTVNEDATLVREDLGLFALADGAGGRGRGDVAATLALRTIENFVGSTVRATHDRPDFDVLGIPEQAKRLSAAVHQAHKNVLEVLDDDPQRQGMATTIVAALFAPRTMQFHLACVGDSRCYRMRHGRLELLTIDDTIATDILEMQPNTADEVLERLPRNSVVRAIGMRGEFRVQMRTVDLLPGDQFLLCSDGLTSAVATRTIWETMRAPDPPSVLASELLNHALAARSQDNISILVVNCTEEVIDEAMPTHRYLERPVEEVDTPEVRVEEGPSSADFRGPEFLAEGLLGIDPSSLNDDDWSTDSEPPSSALEASSPFELAARGASPAARFDAELLEPAPDTQNSVAPQAPNTRAEARRSLAELDPEEESPSEPAPGSAEAPLSIEAEDLELDEDDFEDPELVPHRNELHS